MKKTDIAVLHCPMDVGGNPQGLARAERRLGLKSWSVSLLQSGYMYPYDEVLFSAEDGAIKKFIKRLSLLRRAYRYFDVVHYNFGQCLLPMKEGGANGEGPGKSSIKGRIIGAYNRFMAFSDLKWLKKAGKVIAVTYQGDDARQGDFCRANFEITHAKEVDENYYTKAGDDIKRKSIAMFSRYADLIYSLNPDLLYVLPERAKFMPYAHIDLEEWSAEDRSISGRPVVCHAPTHRQVKGTRHIMDAVSRLQGEGVDFEFTLIEGMSNEEARRAYAKADLLIDQVLAGWYGAVAVEFMALGKPVMAYIRNDDLQFIPDAMKNELPVISADPRDVCQVLRECLTGGAGRLKDRGRRSREYVERWHDRNKVAQMLKNDYETALAGRR